MIWFISDTHFGHARLMESPERAGRFPSLADLDAAIIDGINQYVGRNDVLYHLGDFCWGARLIGHYRQRLKVRTLHVIRGNHDPASLGRHCSTMRDMAVVKFRQPGWSHSIKFHLCHFPIVNWASMHRGGGHLYGHCHGRSEADLNRIHPGRRALDVSADNLYRLFGSYRPISLDDLIERWDLAETRDYFPGPFEHNKDTQ